METIVYWLERIIFSNLFAGAMGACASILFHKPVFSIAAAHVIVGTLGAAYCTLPIIEWQGMSLTLQPIVAFSIGLFSGSIVGSIINMIRNGTVGAIIKDFFYHRYVGGVENQYKGKRERGNEHE